MTRTKNFALCTFKHDAKKARHSLVVGVHLAISLCVSSQITPFTIHFCRARTHHTIAVFRRVLLVLTSLCLHVHAVCRIVYASASIKWSEYNKLSIISCRFYIFANDFLSAIKSVSECDRNFV